IRRARRPGPASFGPRNTKQELRSAQFLTMQKSLVNILRLALSLTVGFRQIVNYSRVLVVPGQLREHPAALPTVDPGEQAATCSAHLKAPARARRALP